MVSRSAPAGMAVAALLLTGCGADRHRGAALPLSFVANQGQFAEGVRFEARSAGLELAATDAGLELGAGGRIVRVGFAGARQAPPVAGARRHGTVSYLLGPRRHTGVPTYGEVVYREAWPGVDVALYGAGGRFEYVLRVAAGADPGAVRLRFGSPVRIAADGSLRIGSLRQSAPHAFQGRTRVASRYVPRDDGTIGVQVGRYDHRRPLVIDPVLAYSTYLGGTGFDEGLAIAVDAAGSAYVTGHTQSTSFPAPGAPQAGDDAFVAKLAPDGHTLEWSTYLGGNGIDQGNGIAVGPGGVVVAGTTTSTNLPTRTPAQGSNAGNQDAFVVELTPGGDALVWGTYLGGGGFDQGTAVALDAAGTAYLGGTTDSTDFHTANAIQAFNGGGSDAFAAKLGPGGLVYSTYLGGSGNDTGAGIAADAGGNAYAAGFAGSPDFPTTIGALQPDAGGSGDAFLTKLSPSGAARVFSTYLGGSARDEAAAVALTTAGAAVVAGTTQSAAFPTTPAGTRSGPSDGFVSRFTADGAALAWSAYLGGSDVDAANAVAVDRDGRTVVAGRTGSADFPTANPAQGTKGAALDAFATQFDAAGATRLMSTFLGGGSLDQAAGVAVDGDGNAYVTGRTDGGLPLAGALQPTLGGGTDAFVAKLAVGSAAPAPIPVPPVPPPPPPPATPETTITGRPPALGPDQVVQFRFSGQGGASFACRLDGGAFTPCTSPYTSARLALAAHTFEVRAESVSGVPDPTPAAFAFRIAQPRPEVRRRVCSPRRVCDLGEVVCPRGATCLLELSVDGARLQRLDGTTYKDAVSCLRRHACHQDGALGLLDTSADVHRRFRCLGSGHAPRPGEGCRITATILRHVTELGQVAATGPSLLVHVPQPGSVTVSGAGLERKRVAAKAPGAVRVPLRITRAARKRGTFTVTTTFQPAGGPALTRISALRLRR